MKKGIYQYSPVLDFSLGNCGKLLLNLAEIENTNTTFHFEKNLYTSSGQNGLSLNLYAYDNNELMNLSLNFSYDVKLEVNENSICIKYPNSCEEEYVYVQKLDAYQLTTGYSTIRQENDNYILTDSNGVEYTFVPLSGTYYLESIVYPYNTDMVTISRDSNQRLSTIINGITKDKILINYYSSKTTIDVYKLENLSYTRIFRYEIFKTSNGNNLEIKESNMVDGLLYNHYIIENNTQLLSIEEIFERESDDPLINTTTSIPSKKYYFNKNDKYFTDYNGEQTILNLSGDSCTITNNLNNQEQEYLWDNKGRLITVSDITNGTFVFVGYGKYDQVIIQSMELYQTIDKNENYIGEMDEIQNNEKTRFEIECVGKANDLFSFVFEVSNCDEEESYDIEIEYINGENVFTDVINGVCLSDNSNLCVASSFSKIDFCKIAINFKGETPPGISNVHILNTCLATVSKYVGKQMVSVIQGLDFHQVKVVDNKMFSFDESHYTYDSFGRVKSVTDKYGNKKTITYEGATGNVKTIEITNQPSSTLVENDIFVKKDEYTYDSYNQTKTHQSQDIKVDNEYRIDGLLTNTKKYIENENSQFELIEQCQIRYQQSYPNCSGIVSTCKNEESDSINYLYYKNNLCNINYNGKTYSNPLFDTPLCSKYFKNGNEKHIIYNYYVKETVKTPLPSTKEYFSGKYFFYYDNITTDLLNVKFSETGLESDAENIHVYEYKTVNNKNVIDKITTYYKPLNKTEVSTYHYNENGNVVCISTTLLGNSFDRYSNGETDMNVLNGNIYLTKNIVKESTVPLTISQQIRNMDENLKLCDFGHEIGFGNKNASYSFLYNSVIDNIESGQISECGSFSTLGLYYTNENSDQNNSPSIESLCVKETDVCKEESKNYIKIKGYYNPLVPLSTTSNLEYKLLHFPLIVDDNYENANSVLEKGQTIAFMFRRSQENVSFAYEDAVLCEIEIPHNKLYLIIHKYGSSESEDNTVIALCKNQGNKLKPIDNALVSFKGNYYENDWCFVALTLHNLYGFNSKLYVNDKSASFDSSDLGDMCIKGITFGSIDNIEIETIISSSTEYRILDFDLTNIIIPYNKKLSDEEINNIRSILTSSPSISNHLLLSNNNLYSLTTSSQMIDMQYDYIDFISFNNSLTSVKGVKPSLDLCVSALKNGDNSEQYFYFDDSTASYAYKTGIKGIQYNFLGFPEPENSIGLSFKFKILNSFSDETVFVKFSNGDTISIMDTTLIYNNGSLKRYKTINLNEWVSFTISADRMYDNCSNAMNQFLTKVYVNSTILFQYVKDDKISGLIDFPTIMNYNSSILIKDLFVSSKPFVVEDINKFTLLNNTNYINKQYDFAGRLKKESIVVNSFSICNTEYSYNDKGELCSSQRALNSNSLYNETYEYDKCGNLLHVLNGPTVIESYTYDYKNQLKTENLANYSCEYSYDSYGNITAINEGTNVELQYDAYNRLIKYGNRNIEYAENNNSMVSMFPSKIGNAELSWQGNRLTSYKNTKNITYFYNENGLRTIKKDNTSGITHLYFYDAHGKLVVEKITSSTETKTINFLYQNDSLYGFIYDGTKYYYNRDPFGTIKGIINSSGTVVVAYVYNSFGKIIDINGPLKDNIGKYNPFRYKGYYYDEETQLYWVSSRYYSPELCRWISPDSIEYLDPESINGLNLYAYCGNDPVNRFDPSGHAWEWSNFWQAAGYLVTGIGAIVAGALVIASGVATWPMLLVAGITIGAGALTTINGVAEVGDLAFNYNFMEDGVFGGNSAAYNTYASITGTVATVGSIVCGGWYRYNTPRIQAYKNIGNYDFSGTLSDSTHLARPYQHSTLLQKNIIKYGKMVKESSGAYKFTIGGSYKIGWVSYGLESVGSHPVTWKLVLDIGKQIIFHAGF